MVCRDRADAGRQLASKLRAAYADRPEVVVLALPRGGVPVAFEVAQALHIPLDVFLVRTLELPGGEGRAMGAIASGGVLVLHHGAVAAAGIPDEMLAAAVAREQRGLERREHAYRAAGAPVTVNGRVVILVDDDVVTGAGMRSAVGALRRLDPARIVVAVPVAAAPACEALREQVDELVCLVTPDRVAAVEGWYDHDSTTTDDEVRSLLRRARGEPSTSGRDRRAG